jgi:filamentous hemagglutinin family protein
VNRVGSRQRTQRPGQRFPAILDIELPAAVMQWQTPAAIPTRERETVSYAAQAYLRRQYLCVLRRCAFLNAFASWLLLAAPAAMAADIVTDGRTQTTLNRSGTVTDITTATVKGQNAFNSFSRFNIGSGQTVNLHLPGQATNLLNLVRNERSVINGVMNAYKDGRIGGNVFFFNPHGMVVGAQGQIKVGSLTVAAPTPEYMERLVGPGGVIDDAAVNQALSGEIPLSESGLITVKGGIRAVRAAQLAAATVNIDAGARIEAGAAARSGFGALVNIDGLEEGAQAIQQGDTVRIVASNAVNIAGEVLADGAAGEAAGRVNITAGGNITIADGGRVAADGHGANSNGGDIRIWADDTATLKAGGELSARGGEVSGDGGHIEFSATKTVKLEGGALKANATHGAKGAVLIDPNDIEVVNTNTYTDGADFTLIANHNITVGSNVTISTRDLNNVNTDNHLTAASQGDSGDLTLRAQQVELQQGARLLAHGDNGHSGGDVKVEGHELDAIGANREATASVRLTGATVTGKDILIRARAETSGVNELLENAPGTTVADAQAWLDNELDDPVDGIGGAFLEVTTKATATTEVLGSTIIGSGNVSISSEAGARSGFEKTATATTTVGDFNGVASEVRGLNVSITSSASTSLVYNILGTATTLLDQSWLPDPNGSLIQTLDDNLFDFNAVPLVALSTAIANTTVDGASVVIAADTLTIDSSATSAAKPGFNSPFLFSAAWGESTAEARTRVVGTSSLTATNALSVTASTDTEVEVVASVDSINKPIDAVFVRANTNITTEATVGDDTATTGGSVAVTATTEAEIEASADAKNTGGSGVGLAVAISDIHSSTTATLGGTAKALSGDVTVEANADIEENNSANAATLGNPSSLSAKITNFKAGIQRNVVGSILSATGKINPTTADRLTTFLFPGIKEGKFNAAGAVGWTEAVNTATASIAPLADVTAGGGVTVRATIKDQPSSSAGSKTSSTGSAVGGAVARGKFTNTATAYIGQGAAVDAKGALLVDAHTLVPYPWQINWNDLDEVLSFLQGGILDMFLSTYSINSAKGKTGIGLAVGVNIYDLANSAEAYIDEGARINNRYKAIPGLALQSVKVNAANDISLTGAVGILSKKFLGTSGGKAAIGGSAGLLSVDTKASATIRGNAEVNSNTTVDVDAINTQRLVAVAEAGGSSDAVGVEGAVTVNTMTNTSTAAIDDDAKVAAGGDITLDAEGDLENISVAGGVVATKGQVGIGFSVSVNTLHSDVNAYIGNFDPLGLDLVPALGQVSSGGNVNLIALSDISQGSYSVAGALATNSKSQTEMPAGAADTQDGGGTAGKTQAGKGKFGVAVSADVSINDMSANTSAHLSDGANIAQATNVDLDATNTLALSALSGAVTISTQQSGNGLAGSYAQNSLAGTTSAYVDEATLALSGDLTADAMTTGFIETLSASVAGTKGKLGIAGSVSINEIDNATKTYLNQVLLTGVGTVHLSAIDDSAIRAIAGAIAFGGKAGIGLSFGWNHLENETWSWIADSDVDAGALVSVAALTDNSIDTISAAIGASQGQMAGAGAVTINTIANSTRTWISGQRNGDGVDGITGVSLASTDSSRIFGLAGALAGSTQGTGVGVSFAWNDVDNTVDTALTGNTDVESTTGSITVEADSSTHIEAIGVGGGVANKVGIAASGSVVQAGNTVKAHIDAGSTATADGNVQVAAADDVDLFSLAGNVSGGGRAAIGLSNSTLVTDNTVEARIDGTATARGKRGSMDVATGTKDAGGAIETVEGTGVAVTATSHEDIETIAAGGSGAGSVAVAGSATVTDLTENTTAAIGATARLNPLDDGAAGQDVTARASDETTLLGVAGAVAFGGRGGVGAGADVGLIGKTTTASIAGEVKAKDTVTVEARSTEDVTSVAASLSAGGSAGIAGSAAVYVVDIDTVGEIADAATVHSDGNVIVSADDANEMDLIAGNGAFGGTAGVGASAAVAVIDKTVTARVGDGATVDALGKAAGVTVADGSFATSYAANSSDEGEIAAPAASNPDGSDSAALTGQRVGTRGTATGFQGLAVTATNQDDIETISATGAGAGTAAITIAGDVNVITTHTTAEIGDNARINQNNSGAGAGQSVLVAAGNDHYQMGIAGSASGAGTVGIGAGADVLVAHHTTVAKVGDSALVRANKDITLDARSKEEILSIAAGLGVGGTVGVAGSTSVLSMTNVTSATTGTGSVVDADGNVAIVASDDTETDVIDGTLAAGFGAAGVGGAVGVTRIEKDTTAGVGVGATVNARGNNTGTMQALSGDDLSDRDPITGLMVEATSSEDLFSVAASGAGGFYAGVSGAVTVSSVDSDTTAVIGSGALINQGVTNGSATQDVNVSARNHVKVDAYTGSLALGAVGAAGGVDVGSVRNDTTALIDDNAIVDTKRDVDVNALASADIDSVTVSAAGGLGAIAGGVSVYSVGSGLDAEGRDRLKSDGGDFADVNSYADDQAADGSINSLLANSDDARIRDAGAQSQAARAGVSISTDLAGTHTAGTTATIGDATVTADGAIDVDARQDINARLLAGGASAGAVGLGAGVGVLSINAGTAADVAALASLSSVGALSVMADTVTTSTLTGFAGSFGGVAADAAVAIVHDDSTTRAALGDGVQITQAGAVTVAASDDRYAYSKAVGVSVGGAAGGASVATVDMGGSAIAEVGNDVQVGQSIDTVGSLSVSADSDITAYTASTAGKAGIGLAASGSVATATLKPTISASIGTDARITVDDDVSVSATATPKAVSDATGVNVSGGVSIGASVATALAAPDIDAGIGSGARISADTVSVKATQDNAGNSAAAYALGAAGGVLAGVNATYAEAENEAHVDAGIGDDSELTVATQVELIATNTSVQKTEVTGVSIGGVLAAGATIGHANSNTVTTAVLGDGVKVASLGGLTGVLDISATSADTNTAEATSGSGGLISGSAASVGTRSIADTRAGVGGGDPAHTLNAAQFNLKADHTSTFNGKVNSVSASAVGASGASATHSVASTVIASVADNARINANHVDIDANNRADKLWWGETDPADDALANADTATWNIQSGSGGALNAAAGSSKSTVDLDTRATIGNGARVHILMPSLGEGSFSMDAFNGVIGHDKVKLDSGGAVAIAATEVSFVAIADALVSFGTNANVTSDLGDIKAGSRAEVDLDTRASSDTYGLAGAPSGSAYSTWIGSHTTTVGSGATLLADQGEVRVGAGQASDGTRSKLVADSEVRLWNKTAFPINSDPDPVSTILSNATLNLQAGASIESAGDITLAADRGTISANHIGIGKDIYREAASGIVSGISNAFGGDDVSFDITGGDDVVGGTSTASIQGTALAGIHRFESLTLDYEFIDENGNLITDPVRDPNSGLVLWRLKATASDGVSYSIDPAVGLAANLQARIDKLRSLMEQYAADPVAVAAYEAEIKFLQFKLVEMGLASGDPNGTDFNTGSWNNPSPKERKQDEINVVEAQIDDLGNDIVSTTGTANVTVDGVLVSQSGIGTDAGNLVTAADSINGNNSTITSTLVSMSNFSAADADYQQMNSLRVSAATLRNEINTLNGQLATSRSALDTSNTKVGGLLTDISNRQTQIDTLLANGGSQSQIDALRAANDTDRAAASAELSVMAGLLDGIATKNAQLDQKSSTLSSTYTSINSLQTTLRSRVSGNGDASKVTTVVNLQTTNTGLRSDVSSLAGSIGSAETSVAGANTSVGGNSTTVQGLESDLGDAQNNLATLEAQLPGLSDVAADGPIADFVHVNDITVRLGNIDVIADNLIGSGALRAPGDAKISIVNNTPDFLVLGKLTVDSDSGGEVRLNGFLINDNTEIGRINSSAAAPTLSLDTKYNNNAGLPQIEVISNYDPNSAKNAKLPAPAPDIQLEGDVDNPLGSVRVYSQAGSIYVDGDIRAAQVDVKADNGDFVQSYVDGFYHTSGDPAANVQGGQTSAPAGNGIIANGSVFISARFLNINGLVQSGIEAWQIDLPNTPVLSGAASIYGVDPAYLKSLENAWKNGTGTQYTLIKSNAGGTLWFNAALARLETTTGYADADMNAADWAQRASASAGLYQLITDYGNIGANYDPSVAGGRYVLDGEAVKGGYIQLFGQILNTAGSAARLKVLDGFGQIVVNNPTDRAVVVNNLSTGTDADGSGRGIKGVIDITDIQRVDTTDGSVDSIHTVITRDNGTVMVDRTGRWVGNVFDASYHYVGADLAATDGRNTAYNPQTGLRYVWTTATDKSTNTYWEFSGTQFLGISQLRTKPTGTVESKSGPYTTGTRRLDDGTYLEKSASTQNLIKTSDTKTTSNTWTKTKEWTDCNWWTICIAQDYHSKWTESTKTTTITKFSLRADYPIAVEFSGNDLGLVAINSKSDVILNGTISNRSGSTTITAGVAPGMAKAGQSILQGSEEALVTGASLMLSASQGVGTTGTNATPVNIDLNGGTLNAAVLNGNLALRQANGDLVIGTVLAGGDANAGLGQVLLAADGNLLMGGPLSSVTGNRIELVSDNGAIGTLADPIRLNAGFTDVLTQRSGYGVKASARGDIFLDSQAWAGNTEGDLLVSSIVSATGDVQVRTPGRIIDNNPFERVDQRSYNELLTLWKELALLENTQANADKQAAALAAFETGATQDYRTYWNIRNQQADPATYDPNTQVTLSARQEQILRDDLAQQGKSNAQIDAIVADYNADKTAEYHTLHQKLYGAPAYDNLIPTSYQEGFAYDASQAEQDSILKGSSWSEHELGIALSPGLLKETTDTNPVLKDPNIAGTTVTLLADKGIGETGLAHDIDLTLNPGLISDADKVALAAAERSDLSISSSGVATVVQRKPLVIDSDGTLWATDRNGNAVSGDVFLASETSVNVGAILATGEARLKAVGDITHGAGPGLPSFMAGSLILESAKGGIGTESTPVLVLLGDTAPLIARADGDIFITQLGNDLAVDTIYSRSGVTLNAPGSILDAFSDDEINIRAASLDMTASGSIGSASDFLDIGLGPRLATDTDDTGWLTALAGTGIYVRSELLPLILHQVDAGTEVRALGGTDVEVEGAVNAPLNVDIAAGDDVRFTGGTITTDVATIAAGGDGTGNVVGSPSAGPDIVATTSTFITAPQGIGTEAPVEVRTARLDLEADTINAVAQPLSLANPLMVNATGVGGTEASDVTLSLKSATAVTIGDLYATTSRTTATTPLFTVTDGHLGDYAAFFTPNFAIRVDHKDRRFQPGFDVRAFTRSGLYDMIVTPESALIGAYIITKNPKKVVFSNPGGVADLRSRGQLNALEQQSKNDKSNRVATDTVENYATAAGDLVFVDPAIFECGNADDPNACEDQ